MNISLMDLIGWIGFLFIIAGYYLNAKKYINCFYIWGTGNIIYIIYLLLYIIYYISYIIDFII